MRRLLVLLVVALALPMAGWVAVAGAQGSDDGVQDLWRQFPLDPSTTTTTPGATNPATTPAPASGSADSASATPAPLPRAQASSSDPDNRTVLLGTAVVALAAAGAAVLLVRRRRTRAPAETTLDALDAPGGSLSTYVQGMTDRNGIGPFEGYVSARAIAPPPLTEPLFLVRDPQREQPVWVRRSEVRTLRTIDGADPLGARAQRPGTTSPLS